jgi:hypothetical protein
MSIAAPKSSLDLLKEKQESILKKLSQGEAVNDSSTDNKQNIVELKATAANIQLAVYEEKSRKLEIERLKIEESTAINAQKRGKVLAKHESILRNASMHKLLSAKSDYNGLKDMAGDGGPLPHGKVLSQDSDSYLPHNLTEKADEINCKVKESAELGKEAAEVAFRRKGNRIKEKAEESIKKKAEAKRKSRKHIDVSV